MTAAVKTRPCPTCLRPVPLGGVCVNERQHARQRAMVQRRMIERKRAEAVVGKFKATTAAAPPLVHTHPMKTVFLIGCGKAKAAERARVRDLYRSSLFQKSLELAELAGDAVFVVSASRGTLLSLDTEVAPYEATVRHMRQGERIAWGNSLVNDLVGRTLGSPVRVVLLMGEAYASPILAALEERRARLTWPEPVDLLRGLEIGERLAALNRAIATAREAKAR